MSDWISVDERFPKVNEEVIAVVKTNHFPRQRVRRVLAVRNPYGKIFFKILDGSIPTNTVEVTHWMPLPEPPEEDEQ